MTTSKRAQFNKALRSRKKLTKAPLIPRTPTYPVRSGPLGRSSGSMEGVAGWRTNYYKLDEK